MTSPAQHRLPMRFDVSDVVGEQASLAATYYPRRTRDAAAAVLVCLPGGTYSREYWDSTFPATVGTASPTSRPTRVRRRDDRPAGHRREL